MGHPNEKKAIAFPAPRHERDELLSMHGSNHDRANNREGQDRITGTTSTNAWLSVRSNIPAAAP